MRFLTRNTREAVDSLSYGWRRALLAVIAIVTVVAIAVLLPGLTRSSDANVAALFTATGGTDVVWHPPATNVLGPADGQRLTTIPSVGPAATLNDTTLIAATPWSGSDNAAVIAAAGDLTGAAGLTFRSGDAAGFTGPYATSPVALVGATAARTLGVAHADSQILIAGLPFRVLGIFDETTPLGLQGSVIVPYQAATTMFPGSIGSLKAAVARTTPENLDMVATAGAAALAPTDPTSLQADYAQGAKNLAHVVLAQLDTTTTLLTTLGALAAGALSAGILSATVRLRAAEIGLRRSLGARRRDIMLQFFIEGLALTLIGLGLGIAAGSILTWTIATTNHWPAVLPPALLETIAIETLAVTLITAAIPAWRAGSTDPVDALTTTN